MIITRQATPDDSEHVQAIIDAAFATVRNVYRPKPNAIPISDNLNLDTDTIVALVDREIAGALVTHQQGANLHISQLAVMSKFRKRGVARAMLQFADTTAIKCGALALRLNTIQETGNVAIFERLGFAVDAITEATWCISDQFAKLNEVSMIRRCTVQSR